MVESNTMTEDARLLSFCQVSLRRQCLEEQQRVAKYENLGKIYVSELVAFDRVNDLVCIE